MKPTQPAIGIAAVDAMNQCRDQVEQWDGFNSLHEAMAVTREEFEELWDLCKVSQSKRDSEEVRREAIQLAACAIEIAALACDPREWIKR
jgi:hypothetical protein